MKMLCMHSVILTELGVAIFDDNKCVKSVLFRDPARDYIELKKEKADVGYIEEEIMEEKKIETIQSSKLRVLVDSGFATNENDARAKLREFAMQLSSSKVTEVSESPDLHI